MGAFDFLPALTSKTLMAWIIYLVIATVFIVVGQYMPEWGVWVMAGVMVVAAGACGFGYYQVIQVEAVAEVAQAASQLVIQP